MLKKIITKVEEGSIGEEVGFCPGDELLSINGLEILDVFDYRYAIANEEIEVEILKPDGESWLIDIEKDEDEDLGLEFETGLMDKAKSCGNRCVFCFVDQLPRGLRKTLYFKDDDFRLSFLMGNYVTLTNMSDKDFERIIFYHLSPINISVHAVDPEIRKLLLGNKSDRAGNIISQLSLLKDANISMNFQIVLCPGLNDGNVLIQSVKELAKLMPCGKSLSIVPVGISAHREGNGLYALRSFSKNEAVDVIGLIEGFQEKFLKEYNTRFVYLADEFYVVAERDVPEYESYEDFPQIENGVGMLASFKEEFCAALRNLNKKKLNRKITVVTGVAAVEFMKELNRELMDAVSELVIETVAVKNRFFGESVTVSGLLTGKDIIGAIKNYDLGDFVLIPGNALRSGENVFLDDITLYELESHINAKVFAVPCDGREYLNYVINGGKNE